MQADDNADELVVLHALLPSRAFFPGHGHEESVVRVRECNDVGLDAVHEVFVLGCVFDGPVDQPRGAEEILHCLLGEPDRGSEKARCGLEGLQAVRGD